MSTCGAGQACIARVFLNELPMGFPCTNLGYGAYLKEEADPYGKSVS